MKTKEQILEKFKKVFYEDGPCTRGTAIEYDDAINAMETYAAQFQKDDRAAKTATQLYEAIKEIHKELHKPTEGPKKAARIDGIIRLVLQSLPPESDQVNT